MPAKRDATTILRDAEQTLETAQLGLAALQGDDPQLRVPGLRNLVVFGRAVTNALQNLRSIDRQRFDDWYGPYEAAMRRDVLMAYFYRLRSVILKEVSVGELTTSTYIEHLNTDDLQPLIQNPPPGAVRFFIGDQIGGSGWDIQSPDGTTTKYYVALPDAVEMETTLHFIDPPTSHRGQPLADTSLEALAGHYIEYLRLLVEDAKRRFTT